MSTQFPTAFFDTSHTSVALIFIYLFIYLFIYCRYKLGARIVQWYSAGLRAGLLVV
jgi:hypothetical protein